MENLYTAGNIYKNVLHKRLDDNSHIMQDEIEYAYIENNELLFPNANSFDKALHEGIFALKIPDSLDIEQCDLFAQSFYLKNPVGKLPEPFATYSKFRELTYDNFSDPLLGFHERVDQIEQFLLEKRFWKEIYPEAINNTAAKLCEISSIIIKCVLKQAGIPKEHFEVATGGCTEMNGSYHLTFNHYRPGIKKKGLSSHKDDGFVTILRTVSEGLEVNRLDKWEKVPIDKGYFIINFGLSMEILTRNSSKPVEAIIHRVAHQKFDRWSWGHFSSSKCKEGDDAGIYQFSQENGLVKICQSRELINNNDYEIYNGTNI